MNIRKTESRIRTLQTRVEQLEEKLDRIVGICNDMVSTMSELGKLLPGGEEDVKSTEQEH